MLQFKSVSFSKLSAAHPQLEYSADKERLLVSSLKVWTPYTCTIRSHICQPNMSCDITLYITCSFARSHQQYTLTLSPPLPRNEPSCGRGVATKQSAPPLRPLRLCWPQTTPGSSCRDSSRAIRGCWPHSPEPS
jgi:hypothetical protein